MLIIDESAELIVVPLMSIALSLTFPEPPACILRSELDDEVMLASCIVKLSMLVVVSVVTPLTPSVELAVKAPVTATVEPAVKAPVISTASAIVTFDESLESKVVPLTLSELKTTSPVPPGVILISAF